MTKKNDAVLGDITEALLSMLLQSFSSLEVVRTRESTNEQEEKMKRLDLFISAMQVWNYCKVLTFASDYFRNSGRDAQVADIEAIMGDSEMIIEQLTGKKFSAVIKRAIKMQEAREKFLNDAAYESLENHMDPQ